MSKSQPSKGSNRAQKRKPLTQLSQEETVSSSKRSRTSSEISNFSATERRAGTINYIILKNFMCHSFLDVDLRQKNINFLVGKNGSGKSAILTALIVGLGGRANLTNRGTSIKNFIKVGKPSSNIEIQLYNEGPMAYHPKKYGKTITISRNITASGGGSFKVKAESGAVISTHAKEVVNITTTLNIQVDNPVCLLTQDTARNFLSSNDPKKKFQLFMKATKLEMLENEYKAAISEKNKCSRDLEDKKASFEKLQEEINRLKVTIAGYKSIVELKDKKLELQNEIQWSQVQDIEKELAEEQQKVDKIDEKMKELELQNNRKAQEIEEIEQTVQENERHIATLKRDLEVKKRPQADMKRELEELKNAFMETKKVKQNLDIEIVSKRKDMEYLAQEIANTNKNMSQVEQQKRERMNNLSQLQNRLKGANEHLATCANDRFQVKNDITKKREDADSLKLEIKHINQCINQEESNLKALRTEQGNSLMLYGTSIPKVKEMIRSQRSSFKYEPKGPLGSYIKLKDKKWAIAVEGYLGGSILGAFTVDNQNDGKLLQQIFARCLEGDHQPTIITSKFLNRKHDVSNNLVHSPPDCTALYDAIIIDDPIVSNCIVDQMNTENVLLIPNGERAMELMSDKRSVPKNCKQSLTMKGDKYYPDPKYRTYGSNYHKARYLQVDTKEHMEYLQENIVKEKNRRQAIQNQLQALQNDIDSRSLMLKELEDKIRKMTTAKQEIRKEYDELSNEAEPEVHDLNNLEDEQRDIQRLINEKEGLLGQSETKLRELKAKITAQEEKVCNLKKLSNEVEERLWPLQEQIQKKQLQQRQLSTNYDYYKQKLEEYQRKRQSANKAVEMKQQELSGKTSEAELLCERPLRLRSVPEISKEMGEVSRNIAKVQTETENIEEVSKRYQNLTEKHASIRCCFKTLTQSMFTLNKAIQNRAKYYKLTENYFVTLIKHSFKKILEYRQFTGNLDINMDQKKLELIVKPQHGSQGQTTTSNLSGGERSFSTVAFLYALWQCMDFSFYFLDEFDVFMDKMNRTKVIEVLLHHANAKPDLQFVFLTPQDMPSISGNVRVLRLQDPQRFNV
ncbi:structural maintenance of chromosomes protein 6 [Euwallacea fornicatus]|uniref:structural maintenance of chromosomes protein 6 n=1 Tax=Euwallacea fornicatus TaxID=995702 RepID=UPI00338D47AC